MKTKLSPSMLSIDFGKVAEQLKLVEDAGTQYIHLDVMDGIFVPNILWDSCYQEHQKAQQYGF